MTDPDPQSCPCGSPWWRLEQDPAHPLPPPAEPSFTMDRDGNITGWSGRPVCIECGEPWRPPRERLSAVPDSPEAPPEPTPAPRRRYVILCYRREGYAAWRFEEGRGISDRDVIVLDTDDAAAPDRIRGYTLTANDTVVRWRRYLEGAHVEAVLAELALASRNLDVVP